MRAVSWWLVVPVLGVVGIAVALLAGFRVVPQAAAIVPLALVPLTVLALAFAGLAKTSAIASYAVVTVIALGSPIADLWSRSTTAGNADDATWLGLTSSIAITVSGLAAILLAAFQSRPQSPNLAAPFLT